MSEQLGALIDDGERNFEIGLDAFRVGTAGLSHHNAYLTILKSLVTEENFELGQACSLLAFASVLLLDERAVVAKTLDNWDAMSEMRAERYRLAWTSARQRAQSHLAALVESDAERDYLAAQLAERDLEVARLTVQLARRSGAMP
jgi:hypothetical protein